MFVYFVGNVIRVGTCVACHVVRLYGVLVQMMCCVPYL